MIAIRRASWLIVLLIAVTAIAGCPKKNGGQPKASQPAEPTETKPVPEKAEPSTREAPGPTEPTSTVAQSPAQSQPAPALPESTYVPEPPYPVNLFVRDPDQKQPGWLKILELNDESIIATVAGTFPEHNLIIIDTRNVSLLRLHIDHLPINKKKRTILRIDDEGIQLSNKDREFVFLRRSPGGTWSVLESPPPEK